MPASDESATRWFTANHRHSVVEMLCKLHTPRRAMASRLHHQWRFLPAIIDRFQTHSNGCACNLRDRRPSLTNSSPFELRVSSAPIPASVQTRLLATQSPTPAAPILNLPALTLRNPKHTDKLPCRQPPRRRSIVKRTFYSDVKLRVMCVKARTVAIARET